MGSGGKGAAGTVAAATIYTTGRSIDTALSWVQSLAVLAAQGIILKSLLDRQKGHYDDITNRQIGLVDTALNNYTLDLHNNLLPTFQAAFPDVPQAAQYVPVNTQAVVFDQMVENLANMSKTEEYTVRVNTLHRYNYIARLALLSPGFMQNITVAAYQIRDLLNGTMSTGDVVEIISDQAEQDALMGRIGATQKTTHRNLGISRMRAQAAGRRELAENVRMLNQDVSPINLETTIHEQMIDPKNRLALALTETERIQQSLQNVFNTAAQKPPYLLAQLQAKLSAIIAKLTYEANKGNMVNQFVPNYAAVFGPMMQSFFGQFNRTGEAEKTPASKHQAGVHPGEQVGQGGLI